MTIELQPTDEAALFTILTTDELVLYKRNGQAYKYDLKTSKNKLMAIVATNMNQGHSTNSFIELIINKENTEVEE